MLVNSKKNFRNSPSFWSMEHYFD